MGKVSKMLTKSVGRPLKWGQRALETVSTPCMRRTLLVWVPWRF